MGDTPDAYRVELSRRLNPSLVFAGLRDVVRRVHLPSSARGLLEIPGYSEPLAVDGSSESVSPPLDWRRLATLREPVSAQLVVSVDGGRRISEPIELLPMSAFSLRRGDARATAVFVLEGSPTVHQLVNRAGAQLPGDGAPHDVETRARLAFEALARADLHYHFELGMLSDYEQAVRFPGQILGDGGFGGGTCVDIALLYAAMLRLLDCGPVVCVTGDASGQQHVLVGIRVADSPGREPIVAAAKLGAAIEAGTITPVEVNTVSRPGASFSEAVERGRQVTKKLGMLWGVDIGSARQAGIRSFPVEPVFQASRSPADEATEALTLTACQSLSPYRLSVVASIVDADRGKTWELAAIGKPRIRIGRGTDIDVRLTDVMVSRIHAALSWRDGSLQLIDLDSGHGTFYGGERIPPFSAIPIAVGDVFSLGPSDNVRLAIEPA